MDKPTADLGVKLELKHWRWIIDWSLEKCTEQIEQAEAEIARHTTLLNLEGKRFSLYNEAVIQFGGSEPRNERIAKLEKFLGQYRLIHTALSEFQRKVRDKSNEQFAEDMREFFKHQHQP